MRNNKQLMAVLALSGLIGVVHADEKDELLKLANSKNIKGDYLDVCNTKELRTLLLIELNNLGKKNGLMGFEQAKNVYL